ncbi:MAG: class II glutamine amidotransferase, partial [Acidobacteria bacterium]|nr:class II glutamine amidotransferase [Acidobacteriota bacterium]
MLASVLCLEMDRRGGDSYGLHAHGELTRELGRAARSIKISRLIEASQVLGHTRKATTGEVTRRNAHPFSIGGIIGAHNGIVDNHRELNRVYSRDFKVDS